MNAKEEIDRLTQELRVYQDKYYKEGISLVTDSEYDRLTDRLAALEREHPELQQVFDKVEGILTDAEIAEMNYKVETEGQEPEDVATAFLKERGLLHE